jgi:hypothetical protein
VSQTFFKLKISEETHAHLGYSQCYGDIREDRFASSPSSVSAELGEREGSRLNESSGGYIVTLVNTTNETQVFATSEAFQIEDGESE